MKKYIFVRDYNKNLDAITIPAKYTYDSIKEAIVKDPDFISVDIEDFEIFYGDYIFGDLFNFSIIDRNEWLLLFHKLKALR